MHRLIILMLLLALPTAVAAEPVVINAVGDIMLAGSGAPLFRRVGFDYPFKEISPLLLQGDLNIGNLESPITRGGNEFLDKKFRFRTDPGATAALQRAGFNHLTLANNHILDFGTTGLEDTISALDSVGITHAGAGLDLARARQERIVTVKGARIALLAYSLTYPAEFYATADRGGTAPGYADYYRADIARARKSADYVIVSFHWGVECADLPRDYQKVAAHRAIDAGADVVLGHHPHVLQGIEYYKGGVVFYSLGNFAFASRSRKADRSMVARITLDRGVSMVEVIPLNVLYSQVKYQPRPLSAAGGDEVIGRLRRLSAGMGTVFAEANGRYLVKRDERQIAAR